MGNVSNDKQSVIDLIAQKLSQINLCLRPEYESQKLTTMLAGYEQVSLYHDPYYGDCYALEGKDVNHCCVMMKQTMSLKDSHSRMEILNQIQISGEGPSNQNTIKIYIIDTFQKSGFLWKKYEIYLTGDFILVDLEKEFQHRIAENNSFSQDEIKTIIKQCTKGFMRLELANYRSVRMKYIYMCGRGKEIKLAHPKLFNYRPNLDLLIEDYSVKNIYLSPEEIDCLERNDSNYEGGWFSNAFAFGMTILSLMTMSHLNEIYNYRACEINFARIAQLLKASHSNFSSHLISIVQNLLDRKQNSRLSLNNLYNQIDNSQILSIPIQLTLVNQKEVEVEYHYEERAQQQPVYPNYISALLKPKVTLTGEYMNLKDEERNSLFSDDSVVANYRLRYSKSKGGEIGQYVGDTSQFEKAKGGDLIRQGKGYYQHKDGQSYIGDWHMGKMQGYGKLFYPNKKLRYEGEFKDGKFYGNGVEFQYEQIREREEQIEEDYVKIFKGNWIKYEGFYENDLKEGVGKIYFRQGYWRGNFKKGQPNGEGVYFCYRTNQSTRGYWREGELQEKR